jgi:6-phosphogluconolactonase
MQLHIFKNTEELVDELAKWITAYIIQALKKQDRFTIALSGGETPKTLYKALSAEPYCKEINWNKMHFFWGDERVVPFTDERSNAKMAYENLLNKVDIPAENVHAMRTDLPPDAAAKEYEEILHKYFNEPGNSFDLVLLGMGKDGHTLSLFPGSPVLIEPHNWVNSVFVKEQKMWRITLMPGVVNKASAIIFLITGLDKSKALQKVLEGPREPYNYPAQFIDPANGDLHWFLNDDAAKEIKKPSKGNS